MRWERLERAARVPLRVAGLGGACEGATELGSRSSSGIHAPEDSKKHRNTLPGYGASSVVRCLSPVRLSLVGVQSNYGRYRRTGAIYAAHTQLGCAACQMIILNKLTTA